MGCWAMICVIALRRVLLGAGLCVATASSGHNNNRHTEENAYFAPLTKCITDIQRSNFDDQRSAKEDGWFVMRATRGEVRAKHLGMAHEKVEFYQGASEHAAFCGLIFHHADPNTLSVLISQLSDKLDPPMRYIPVPPYKLQGEDTATSKYWGWDKGPALNGILLLKHKAPSGSNDGWEVDYHSIFIN